MPIRGKLSDKVESHTAVKKNTRGLAVLTRKTVQGPEASGNKLTLENGGHSEYLRVSERTHAHIIPTFILFYLLKIPGKVCRKFSQWLLQGREF